ncbi:hypothetical protein [Mesonia sp. K7]|uniref:hypothetical protein n=1 Tax=Mesonia sp. K7 TaxID=2218606 RepID=UPI000DA77BA4|nr:hypothetical protein [Mesonia sp. K7]PZD78203.1 hypothetical protein DNG35_05740 [Mesonia sp. K7]
MNNLKSNLLLKGLLFDALGMATSFIPAIGLFLDIVWAPFAAKQMSEMYPDRKGKIASVIVFVEEILPFTDFVPTFTIMWFYTFVFSKNVENHNQEPKIIDAEIISK